MGVSGTDAFSGEGNSSGGDCADGLDATSSSNFPAGDLEGVTSGRCWKWGEWQPGRPRPSDGLLKLLPAEKR